MNSTMAMKSELDTKELLLLESEVKNRGKNMVVAYLLWWFLGILGGHRFYIGKTGSAIAMLILSITFFGLIITAVWVIVDAFLLHKYVKDINDDVERQVLSEIENRRA